MHWLQKNHIGIGTQVQFNNSKVKVVRTIERLGQFIYIPARYHPIDRLRWAAKPAQISVQDLSLRQFGWQVETTDFDLWGMQQGKIGIAKIQY